MIIQHHREGRLDSDGHEITITYENVGRNIHEVLWIDGKAW
jgi:hypothetical protein